MDWGRAKSVLILAFLVLNIILGYQLWLDVRDQLTSSLDWTSLSEDTKQMMEEKHIQVSAELPSETPSLPERTFKFVDNDQDGGRIELKKPVASRLFFMEKDQQKTLKDQISAIDRYRYDPLTSTDGVFAMNYVLDQKWPMFEVRMELFYANQYITAYRESMVSELAPKDKEKTPQRIISATNALDSLITKYLPPGSVVKEIILGYHGQVYNETLVTAPAWRFILESGDIYYMNAISGEVYHPKGDEQKG